MGWKHRLGTECRDKYTVTEGETSGRVGTKHRLGTECREYKYRGEWDGNTGWELSVESTSTGENGINTVTEWRVQVQGRVGTKHRLGTECREYKYRGEWEGNTCWELSAESTSRGESGNKTQAGN